MFTTLYRLEMSPQQQQAYQQQQQVQQKYNANALPTGRPTDPTGDAPPEETGPSGTAELYQREKPHVPETVEEITTRMGKAKGSMLNKVQNERFTKMEMERVADISGNIRKQIENGNLTEAEAQQVLIKAMKEDSKGISRWMRGLGEVPWYSRDNADMIEDYVDQNKQAFEEYNRLQREVEEDKQRLDYVYDKKSPKYQKAMQALGQKTQRYTQLGKTLQQGLFGNEAIEGNIELQQAKGEDSPAV